jgi:hypothetical protein
MAGGELGERRADAASAARRSRSGGLAAVALVGGGSMEAVVLRWIAGGEGLTLARVSGDVVGMAETASRRNKGAGARSPSRQGHLWPRWRAAGLVSSQIGGSGEGGLSGHGRFSTLPWSFGSRRALAAVVFPSAGRGGEGVEGDGTIAFPVRVFRVFFFEMRLSRREASSGRPWWRGEEAARRGVDGWDLLLGDRGLEVLLGLYHLPPARWSGKDY